MTVAFLGKLVEPNKSLLNTLITIYGLNLVTSNFVLEYYGLKFNIKISEIEEDLLKRIEESVRQFYFIEDEVKKINKDNLSKIMESNNLRAIRHNVKLPVNGQRTHTNAQTRRDKKDNRRKGRSNKNTIKKS